MKTIYLSFLSIVVFTTTLTAQPILNSNNLQTGLAFNLYSMSDFELQNLAPDGANISWDVSGATATLMATVNFLEMSDTPYEAAYPAANFAMKLTSILDGSFSYSLFHLSESVFEEVANNVGTDNPVSFLNYRTSLIFPFPFNSSNSDTYQKENQEIKTIESTYDAFGTFKVNGSNINNVIRFNTDDNGTLSLNWWKSVPLVPLFQASGSGFILWELSSTPVGISETHTNQLFTMFPNPATNELHILNKEPLSKIEIYNSVGQLQFSSTKSIIDISGLKSGTYILKALSAKGNTSQKFIKN